MLFTLHSFDLTDVQDVYRAADLATQDRFIERLLSYAVEGSEPRTITVRISQPVMKRDMEWWCFYAIRGFPNGPQLMGACGVDSFGALLAVIDIIGTDLRLQECEYGGTLTFHGNPCLGFGWDQKWPLLKKGGMSDVQHRQV